MGHLGLRPQAPRDAEGYVWWDRWLGHEWDLAPKIDWNADHFFRYGYFNPKEIRGKQAIIQVVCQYPDGRSATTDLTLVDERGGWKLAYYESGLPF